MSLILHEPIVRPQDRPVTVSALSVSL